MIDGKSVRKKLIGSDNERAVSPVIGVILMVAITVILAAVIAAFVLDMGPGQSAISASATLEPDAANSEVTITVDGGGGNMDGIAVVDQSGSVQGTTSGDVNTGGTYTLSGTSGETNTVYGFAGSVSGSIDDADAYVELGEVDL